MSSTPVAVGFDESLLYLTRGGIARYIVCLRQALAPLEDAGFRVAPLAFRVPNFEYRQPARMLKTLARENIWQPFFFSRELRRRGCNVLHMPCWYGYPSPPGVRRVATLHDLHYLITPERFRAWTRFRSRRELQKLAACDRIISVSRSTADDAMRLLHIPARKIDVVPLGCSFKPDAPEEPVPFPLPGRFFLFVSSLEPGKNLALLGAVWRLAEAGGKPLPPLVVVGQRVARVATEGEPPSSWIYAGRLPDEQVVHLYRRAEAFLYPSKYEGFGLPVLEAMILDCPVVCSPHSSLPEVGGEAAVYAEQTPEAYLAALRRLLDDPDYRASRIEPGRAWAKTFTWERTARQTLEIYRSLFDVMSGFTQRALIVELWGLGDGVLATPMLQAFRERAIPVTMLCKAGTAALLRPSHPQVDFQILAAPWTAFRGKYQLWKWPWGSLVTTVLRLHRQHFEIAVSVREDPRDHFLMWLAGARRRVGFPRAGSRLLLSVPAGPGPADEHIVRRWWRLERALFGSSLEFPPHLDPPTRRAAAGNSLPTLCVHCGAQIRVRRWPEASFAEMLRRVRATFECRIVLIPDPDGYGRSLAAIADATHENLDFPDLARDLADATVVLANDSGPAHLADALGTPVAAVFGPQTPARFRPFSERNTVLARDLCPHRPCSDYCRFPEPICLTRLTVDTVWPEFRDFLLARGFSLRHFPESAK